VNPDPQQRSAVEWRDGRLQVIDQTVLPGELRVLQLGSVAAVVDALRRLVVRGAPAIGVCGAFGVVVGLAEREPRDLAEAQRQLAEVAAALEGARPTAVNLRWAVRRVVTAARAGADLAAMRRLALEEALRVLEEDRAACRRMGEVGRAALAGRDRLLTHCNTGRLATSGTGTALAVVYAKAAAGDPVRVWATETRPLLQGARLTCWELRQLGIEHYLACDGAAPFLISQGMADAVVVGADRVAANGDVANKVGTFSLALAARRAGIPFVVAVPESTIDDATEGGGQIPLEQRSAEEITHVLGVPAAPDGTPALNYAFDVTPAELVTAIVTEDRLIFPGGSDFPGTSGG
jgi:methylthioribose-1-phosphate isomerase